MRSTDKTRVGLPRGDVRDAMSYGNIQLSYTEADINDYWLEDIDSQYDNGVDAKACGKLILSGIIEMTDDEKKLIKDFNDTAAVLSLWQHACNSAGIPLDLSDSSGSRKPNKQMTKDIGHIIGVDTSVDAYFAGVPVEDLLI